MFHCLCGKNRYRLKQIPAAGRRNVGNESNLPKSCVKHLPLSNVPSWHCDRSGRDSVQASSQDNFYQYRWFYTGTAARPCSTPNGRRPNRSPSKGSSSVPWRKPSLLSGASLGAVTLQRAKYDNPKL